MSWVSKAKLCLFRIHLLENLDWAAFTHLEHVNFCAPLPLFRPERHRKLPTHRILISPPVLTLMFYRCCHSTHPSFYYLTCFIPSSIVRICWGLYPAHIVQRQEILPVSRYCGSDSSSCQPFLCGVVNVLPMCGFPPTVQTYASR